MSFKAVVALALIVASSAAQARVTEPSTIKSFEVGMAEARASVARAKTANALAMLLSGYQTSAFKNCYVTFYLKQAGNVALSPVRFARNFGWGVVVGKEVIRRNYGIEGSRVECGESAIRAAANELSEIQNVEVPVLKPRAPEPVNAVRGREIETLHTPTPPKADADVQATNTRGESVIVQKIVFPKIEVNQHLS